MSLLIAFYESYVNLNKSCLIFPLFFRGYILFSFWFHILYECGKYGWLHVYETGINIKKHIARLKNRIGWHHLTYTVFVLFRVESLQSFIYSWLLVEITTGYRYGTTERQESNTNAEKVFYSSQNSELQRHKKDRFF